MSRITPLAIGRRMMVAMTDIALELYLAFGLALGAGLIALIGLGVKRAIAVVGWERGRRVLDRAWDLLATVAGEANATLQAQLLAARAEDSPGGREVTREEWREAVAIAVAKFKTLYGSDSLRQLADALGIELGRLDDWIGTAITSEVRVPTATVITPPPGPR